MSRYMNAQALRPYWVMNVIPDLADLQANVKPGDGVKVLAAGRPVWLEVARVDGDTVIGTVTSTTPGSGIEKGDTATARLWNIAEHLKTKREDIT